MSTMTATATKYRIQGFGWKRAAVGRATESCPEPLQCSGEATECHWDSDSMTGSHLSVFGDFFRDDLQPKTELQVKFTAKIHIRSGGVCCDGFLGGPAGQLWKRFVSWCDFQVFIFDPLDIFHYLSRCTNSNLFPHEGTFVLGVPLLLPPKPWFTPQVLDMSCWRGWDPYPRSCK